MQANNVKLHNVKLPSQDSNQVKIQEDGKTITYTVCVTDIRFERNGNVFGHPSLEKCITTPCPDRKVFNWKSLLFEYRPSYPNSYQVHTVYASFGAIFKKSAVCHDETSIGYNLREELLNNHVWLPVGFLDDLLLPIEKRILESLKLVLAND